MNKNEPQPPKEYAVKPNGSKQQETFCFDRSKTCPVIICITKNKPSYAKHPANVSIIILTSYINTVISKETRSMTY